MTSKFSYIVGGVIAVAIVALGLVIKNVDPQSNVDIIDEGPVESVPISNEQPTVNTTLVAVGDIMLGRTVEDMSRAHGWDYPFTEISDVIQSADISFANLEAPFIEGEVTKPYVMVLRANPTSASAVTNAGFDVVSLANNHAGDFGKSAILRTHDVLSEVGIAYTGTGETLTEALEPAIKTVQGNTFGFLAFVEKNFTPQNAWATVSHAGAAIADVDRITKEVTSLSKNADVVVVSLHAGVEYDATPTRLQIELAHAAIDAGAEVVIGHHPHVVQPVEKYKDGYIFYSLGNFIFDQFDPIDTREGAIATLHFRNNKVESYALTPVLIEHYSQPRILDAESGKHILDRMKEL